MTDQHPEPGLQPMDGPPDGLAPPPAASTRRPLTKAVLTAMAGLLVVGAVVTAIVTLSAGDGSASAEAAVHRLFDAVDRQDAIGVAESLEPTERRILITAMDDAAGQARRVKVANDRLDLHAVDGVDLTVDDLQLQVTPLDDHTSAVDIGSGRISSRTQLSKMPIGPVVQEVIDRSKDAGDDVDDATTDEIELTGTRIVAVERGGEWYVSALFSLAEQIRLDGKPVAAYPDERAAIPAVGATSPEAAVREGIAAAVHADVRRLIELTPADEARVLHTYGQILVDEAKGEKTDVTVDDLELEVSDLSNGRKRVSATSMTMTVTSEWDRQITTYDGRCSTTRWEVTDPEAYDYGDEGSGRDWTQCDDDASSLSPFALLNVLSSPGSVDVVVEEHDGAWFLSPTGTVVENTVGAVKGLDVDAVRRIARAWSGEWWIYQAPELWKACGVTQPGLDDSRTKAEAAYERCMESLPQDYAGPWGPLGGNIIQRTEDAGFAVPGQECFQAGGDQFSMDAIENCLADLVAKGELDPAELESFRCGRIFEQIDTRDDLSGDERDSLMAKADAQYQTCIERTRPAGSTPGGGVSFGSGETTPEPTPTTVPAPKPTVTRPPATTTQPPATTTSTTQP